MSCDLRIPEIPENPTRMSKGHTTGTITKHNWRASSDLLSLYMKWISSPSSYCHVRRREEYLNYSYSPTGDLTTCLNFPVRQDRKEYIFFTMLARQKNFLVFVLFLHCVLQDNVKLFNLLIIDTKNLVSWVKKLL